MTIIYGSREARRRLGELIDLVSSGKEVAIIERSGKPMVALIPVEQ